MVAITLITIIIIVSYSITNIIAEKFGKNEFEVKNFFARNFTVSMLSVYTIPIIWILIIFWVIFWIYKLSDTIWHSIAMLLPLIIAVAAVTFFLNTILLIFKYFISKVFFLQTEKNIDVNIQILTLSIVSTYFFIAKIIWWIEISIITIWLWIIWLILFASIWIIIYKMILKNMLISEYKVAKIEEDDYKIQIIKKALKDWTIKSYIEAYKNA